jgi:hypothetical protein
MKHCHDVELSEEFNNFDRDVRDKRMGAASNAYSKYQSRIEAIVSSRATLPHLELLD